MKKPKTPAHDLVEVQALVAARKVRWSVSKAIDPLREEFGAGWRQNGYEILGKLCLGAFHDTINQNHVDFDVYAVSFSGIGWYVKISIEPVLNVDQTVSEQVFSISCHPLGKALMTNDGEVQP